MKILKIIKTFFIFIAICTLHNILYFGYGLNDAFWRVVWWIDEGTIYSENFSEEKFSLVKIGMDSKRVKTLLGEPLYKVNECIQDCTWIYSKQNMGSSDFDQRWVMFDKENKVIQIRKSFFID